MQSLYGTDAVGEAFKRLSLRDESGDIILYSDDGSDDDDAWEDNMDSITFAQYYAGPLNPHFVKMVQDHDNETRARLHRDIMGWAEGVADPELGLSGEIYRRIDDYGFLLQRCEFLVGMDF